MIDVPRLTETRRSDVTPRLIRLTGGHDGVVRSAIPAVAKRAPVSDLSAVHLGHALLDDSCVADERDRTAVDHCNETRSSGSQLQVEACFTSLTLAMQTPWVDAPLLVRLTRDHSGEDSQ